MSPKFSILEKLQNIRKVTSAWKKQASKKAPWGGGGGFEWKGAQGVI